MGIHELYQLFLKAPAITTDSRKIVPQSLFFALKGDNFDGNEYAAEAINKGAAYAIVDNSLKVTGPTTILVDSVLETLQQLAIHHRRELGIPIIAITGSNGKTTTKELVSAVLKEKYKVSHTLGNLNNHIGVPLTLLSFTNETEIGIVEMGANHAGEIDALCKIAMPDFGLITNVGYAHLEGFGSFEGVIAAKTELYRYLAGHGGKAFVNFDNPYLMKSAEGLLTLITYGTHEETWLRGEIVNSPPYLNLRVWFKEGLLYFNTSLIGDYNFENVLAAIAVGRYFNIGAETIKKGVESYHPQNNRSQLIKAATNTLIMDAYNANPTSMSAAVDNFMKMMGKGKTCILGDMLELGEYSQHEHQCIVDIISRETGVEVFLVGELFSGTNYPKHFHVFLSTNQLVAYIEKNPIKNSFILLKGSRGIGLEKVRPYLMQ